MSQENESYITCDCGLIITVNDVSQDNLDYIKKTHYPIISCPACGAMIFVMEGEE